MPAALHLEEQLAHRDDGDGHAVLEALGVHVAQLVEVLAQLGLQLVEHTGGVLLQLLDGVCRFNVLYACPYSVIHKKG